MQPVLEIHGNAIIGASSKDSEELKEDKVAGRPLMRMGKGGALHSQPLISPVFAFM